MLNNLKSYGIHNLQNLNLNKLNYALKQKFITNYKKCIEFEKKICKITKSKYSVTCNNGTSALLMSLLSLKMKNIFAIIPNINFVAIASIVNLLKGKYIICDVNEKTGMIDLNSFLEVINYCKKKKIKPNIFFPVHYAGNLVNLKKIKKIAKKEKIIIVEDGCHSFGSKNQLNNIVGSCANSTCTTFSFHPVKNITTIEGGAITTNNFRIYKSLLSIRNHSLIRTSLNDPYILDNPSLNFRMGEVNAEIGLQQIKLLNKFKIKRQNLTNYYIFKLRKFDKYFRIYNFKSNKIFWHLFVICLKKDLLKKKKDFMFYLRKKNISTQIHYKPLSSHRILKKNALKCFSKNSNIFYNSQLTLPLHTKMNFNDIDYVSSTIESYIKSHIRT